MIDKKIKKSIESFNPDMDDVQGTESVAAIIGFILIIIVPFICAYLNIKYTKEIEEKIRPHLHLFAVKIEKAYGSYMNWFRSGLPKCLPVLKKYTGFLSPIKQITIPDRPFNRKAFTELVIQYLIDIVKNPSSINEIGDFLYIDTPEEDCINLDFTTIDAKQYPENSHQRRDLERSYEDTANEIYRTLSKLINNNFYIAYLHDNWFGNKYFAYIGASIATDISKQDLLELIRIVESTRNEFSKDGTQIKPVMAKEGFIDDVRKWFKLKLMTSEEIDDNNKKIIDKNLANFSKQINDVKNKLKTFANVCYKQIYNKLSTINKNMLSTETYILNLEDFQRELRRSIFIALGGSKYVDKSHCINEKNNVIVKLCIFENRLRYDELVEKGLMNDNDFNVFEDKIVAACKQICSKLNNDLFTFDDVYTTYNREGYDGYHSNLTVWFVIDTGISEKNLDNTDFIGNRGITQSNENRKLLSGNEGILDFLKKLLHKQSPEEFRNQMALQNIEKFAKQVEETKKDLVGFIKNVGPKIHKMCMQTAGKILEPKPSFYNVEKEFEKDIKNAILSVLGIDEDEGKYRKYHMSKNETVTFSSYMIHLGVKDYDESDDNAVDEQCEFSDKINTICDKNCPKLNTKHVTYNRVDGDYDWFGISYTVDTGIPVKGLEIIYK